jgi:hypothetical protein
MRCLIVMLMAVSAFAQRPKNDGNFWVNSSPSFKIGWVSGYAEGMEQAAIMQMSTCVLAQREMEKRRSPLV